MQSGVPSPSLSVSGVPQPQVPGSAEHAGHGLASGEWLSGMPLYLMLGLVASTEVLGVICLGKSEPGDLFAAGDLAQVLHARAQEIATLILELGTITKDLRTSNPLRIRVSMSAMGSVSIVVLPHQLDLVTPGR